MSWTGHALVLAKGSTLLLILYLAISVSRYISRLYVLRHVPKAKKETSNGWLANFLKEPKAPEISKYILQTPNNGLIRYSGMLGMPRIVVTDSKNLREILYEKSYDFQKSAITRRIVKPLLGGGLLTIEGDLHKIQKKKLGPAFAPRHIKDLVPGIWNKTRDLIAALEREIAVKASLQSPASKEINFSVWAARSALDIISVAAFGRDFDAIDHPESPLSQAYSRLFRPRQLRDLRSTLAILLPLRVLQALPLQRNAVIKSSNRIIRAFCQEAIRNAKRDLKSQAESLELSESKIESPPSRITILNIALRSDTFTDSNLIDHLMTAIVAGHETTANTLSWAVHNLCLCPNIQTRLRSEIRSRVSSPKKVIQPDVEDLPYLKAVINETLRLFPVIPLIFREATVSLSLLGYSIPAGTTVIVSPWAANRSPREWGPDADTFNPERWLESDNDNGEVAKTGALLTFSQGPRLCIGQGLARAELAVLLAGIVGSFELEVVEEVKEEWGFITLKPAGGLKIRMRRVEGW